jgi:hypothetical protein
MWRSGFVLALAGLATCSLTAGRAAAHPGSGIAVDGERGHVYFADTREGAGASTTTAGR